MTLLNPWPDDDARPEQDLDLGSDSLGCCDVTINLILLIMNPTNREGPNGVMIRLITAAQAKFRVHIYACWIIHTHTHTHSLAMCRTTYRSL